MKSTLSTINPPSCQHLDVIVSDTRAAPQQNLKNMNYQQIKAAQKINGYSEMQEIINNGHVWKMEGSFGREAMSLLECGACMLPKKSYTDYYGNRTPSRDDLKAGTKGTFANSVRFYSNL
jgi:hypothetical protein